MVSQQTTPLVSSRLGITFGLCSLAVFLVMLDTTILLCRVALFTSPREQSNKSLHSEHTPFIECRDASSRARRSAAG